MRISVAGENALLISIAETSSPEVAAKIHHVTQLIEAQLRPVLIDLIPSYVSILVLFDVMQVSIHQVRSHLKSIMRESPEVSFLDGKLVELPVYYGEEVAPDLPELVKTSGLSAEQVITMHQSGEYHVYAIGFAPGFAFLGQVNEQISKPRRATPRKKVPMGSVGIADRQTAVYPAASPGGWNLIGRCPVTLFDPDKNPAMPFQIGDRIKFKGISREQYLASGGLLDLCED